MLHARASDNLKIVFGTFLVVAGFFLMTLDAHAAVTAPKQTTGAGAAHNAVGTTGSREQAFAGIDFDSDYTLTGISLKMYKIGAPSDSVTVDIYDSNLGVSAPYNTGSVLRSVTLSNTAFSAVSYQWVDFDFATPLSVSSGDDLAVRVRRTGSNDNSNYYRLHGNGSDADGPDDTRNAFSWDGAAWNAEGGTDPFYEFLGDAYVSPHCALTSANAAWSASGRQTIHAVGTCGGFSPTTSWIGAVRYDPVGVHAVWSEGYGPFPDPYSLDTSDLPHQTLPNGTYRVRMYGVSGGTTYVSGNFVDVVLDGDPFGPLTVGGDPGDWSFSEDDTPLSASTTGIGYTISASAAALAAGGGLVISREGCATIGEDATSTECVFAENTSFLRDHFPLLTWPVGIFDAFYDAYAVFDASATPAYAITITGQGNWIPDLTLVDSASTGAGIGRYITPTHFEFFYSVLELSLWLFFVRAMYRKYQSLL